MAPVPGSPRLPRAGEGLPRSTKINDDSMSLEINGQVIATAEFREHAGADGRGASSSELVLKPGDGLGLMTASRGLGAPS